MLSEFGAIDFDFERPDEEALQPFLYGGLYGCGDLLSPSDDNAPGG